jgi:hypothetical protein
MKMTHVTRRLAASLVIAVLTFSGGPAALALPPQNPGSPSLQGRVFAADKVTPITGAVVRAVRGDGIQVYSSLPTDEKGTYAIENLALGSYDLLVELPDGVYVVERTVGMTEPKVYSLSLATVPAENVEKKVTAVDKPVKGYAWTLEGKGPSAGFWKSPGGIAIIAGGAVAAIALALSGDSDEDNNKGSNSTP